MVGDTECGTLPASFGNGAQWVTVTCPGNGVVGESVRIEKDSQALILCGLKVYGHWWDVNVNTIYDLKDAAQALDDAAQAQIDALDSAAADEILELTESLDALKATKEDQDAVIEALNELRAGCITSDSIAAAWSAACVANGWPYAGTSKCTDATFTAGYVPA